MPGPVDVNDEQTKDWNVNPPPLYIWSRPDWTDKHKAIAQQHGHLSRTGEKLQPEEEHHNLGKSSTVMDDDSHVDNKKEAGVDASCKKRLRHDCSGTEGDKNDDWGKNHSTTNSKGTKKRRLKRGPNVKFTEDKSICSRSSDMPCISEVDKSYARDVDISSRVHLQGTAASDVSNAGPGFPSSSGQEVPRLDELNHTRVNSVASGTHLVDTKSIDPPVPRPVFLANTFYFAPGPYCPSPNNTAGWLDE